MNYYNEIKNELINNEINRKVKNYSINKSDLDTYYNVGKLLLDAGNQYGESIIKEFSIKLTEEVGLGYSQRNLRNMRQFYKVSQKWQTLSAIFETLYRIVSYFLNFFDYTLNLILQLVLKNILL